MCVLEWANGNVLEYVVAHELHANGDHHLHMYIKLEKGVDTRDPHFADIGGYHGNYQGCRSAKNVLVYCTKAEDYISNIDVANIVAKTNTKKKIGVRLLAREPLARVVEDCPELIFGYKRLKLDVLELE